MKKVKATPIPAVKDKPNYGWADVTNFGQDLWKIDTGVSFDNLVHKPLDWQKRGLQESRTGYGAKLTSAYMVQFNFKLYRIYHTCYGNSSSAWFKAAGKRIHVG